MKKQKEKLKQNKGITLIALVITIMSKYSNANRRKWDIKPSSKGKE